MKRILLPFVLLALTVHGQAQSLTDGTFSAFSIDSVALSGTGGEAGVYPVVVNNGLAAGFMEIVLLSQAGDDIPSAEVVDITSTTATVRWEKIDGATGYTLNLYSTEDSKLIATYSLDKEGKLKAAQDIIDFNLTDLSADTEYFAEVIAYNGNLKIASQSLILKTSGTSVGNEDIDGTVIYTRDRYLCIETPSAYRLTVFNTSGMIVVNQKIVSDYSQTLPAGIYIVVLQDSDNRKVYKVLIK